MSFKNKFGLIILSASLVVYSVAGAWLATRAQQPANDPGAQQRIFESVLGHIQNDYVDEPNMEKVRAGALRGLAYGLDPYSTYLTPDQVKSYQANSKSTQVGIGAELSQVASFLYVVAPIKGSPADQAGVRAGDVIEYIDGKATRDISLYDARQLLDGAPGSEVKLRILRTRPLTVTVKRSSFRAPAAEGHMEVGKIGVLRINSLDNGEAADARARLQDLVKQGAQKIVVDLRNVAGGEIQEGVTVANFFIRDGSIAKTIGRSQKVLKTFDADPKLSFFNGPASVLIDNGTAGAAEVVASAFLEHKRGDVVGERSFGAGADQELFLLRDGDGLLLTTVKWASASGKPFLGEDRARSGIAPSIEVKRPDNLEASDLEDISGPDDETNPKPAQTPGKPQPEVVAPKPQPEDTQLKKAIELLREKSLSRSE
jgi:carboxyl-terminal processing protease